MSGIVRRFPLLAAPLMALLAAARSSPPPPPTLAPLANGTTAPTPASTPADDTVYVETPVGLLRNDPGTFPGYTLFNLNGGDAIYLRTAPGGKARRCRPGSGPTGCGYITIAGFGSIATPRIIPAGKDWI